MAEMAGYSCFSIPSAYYCAPTGHNYPQHKWGLTRWDSTRTGGPLFTSFGVNPLGESECILIVCLLGTGARNEHANLAAFRPQRPRCHAKASENKRRDDVKSISAITANRCARRGRAGQVKKYACVRPFLEPRETWRQYGNRSAKLPKTQNGEEIHWVAKFGNHAMRVGPVLKYLRNAAASDWHGYKDRHYPINNGFAHGTAG